MLTVKRNKLDFLEKKRNLFVMCKVFLAPHSYFLNAMDVFNVVHFMKISSYM